MKSSNAAFFAHGVALVALFVSTGASMIKHNSNANVPLSEPEPVVHLGKAHTLSPNEAAKYMSKPSDEGVIFYPEACPQDPSTICRESFVNAKIPALKH